MFCPLIRAPRLPCALLTQAVAQVPAGGVHRHSRSVRDDSPADPEVVLAGEKLVVVGLLSRLARAAQRVARLGEELSVHPCRADIVGSVLQRWQHALRPRQPSLRGLHRGVDDLEPQDCVGAAALVVLGRGAHAAVLGRGLPGKGESGGTRRT